MQKDILFASFEQNLVDSNGTEFRKNKNVEFLEDDVVGRYVKVPAGGYLLTNNTGLAVGTGDFTMDCWIYYMGGECSVSTMKLSGQYGIAFMLSFSAAYAGGGSRYYTTFSYRGCPQNVWSHYALVRKDGVFYCFLNGELHSTVPASYNIASSELVFNALYLSSSPGYVSGSANCYKNFRFSGYARWTEDFTPPDPKQPVQIRFPITEKYQLEDGRDLQIEVIKTIPSGSDYTAGAAIIDGYSCIGHRVDDGMLQDSNVATIDVVSAEHVVVFVYAVNSPDSYEVIEKYELENGTELDDAVVKHVASGNGYAAAAPVFDGYDCIGHKIDGGMLQPGTTATIASVVQGHVVVFIYRLKQQDGCGCVPAGMVMYFSKNVPPCGWLVCDGNAVSRSQYNDLFSVIGTDFGVGDGSATFNLPNLQGEFIRGFDGLGQVDPGREFGSRQKATVQAFDPTRTSIYMIGLYNTVDDDASKFPGMIGAEIVDLNDYPGVAAAGTDSGTSVRDDEVCFAAVRPRNVALLPCIKY